MEFVIVIAVLLLIFWLLQLLDLMWRRDEEFPGRLDKVAWAIIVVFAGPLGALAFLFGKPAREPVGPAVAEEEETCLQCGGRLPEGSSKCPACGWSYESPGET